MRPVAGRLLLREELGGPFNELLQASQEARREGSVYHLMIAREANGHHLPNDDIAASNHGFLHGTSNSEQGVLGPG